MAEGVVESKEEMKRKMEKKKEQEKKDVIKIQPKQIETPPKTDESKKTEEVKEKLSTAKEDTEQKFTGVKEDAKDRWGNVQDNIGDFRDEAAAKLEQYRKESEKAGRNPAEKFVSDLFAGIRQKTEEANQAVMEKTGVLAINFPLTDVIESPASITIISDIPGLTKEDIDVGISQTTVEISATYDKEPAEPDSQFLQKERGYGKVSRVIELPATIDMEKTTANYKNNVLTIVLPKKERDVTKVVINE